MAPPIKTSRNNLILTLRKSGWDRGRIARELKTSVDVVKCVIYRYNKANPNGQV